MLDDVNGSLLHIGKDIFSYDEIPNYNKHTYVGSSETNHKVDYR